MRWLNKFLYLVFFAALLGCSRAPEYVEQVMPSVPLVEPTSQVLGPPRTPTPPENGLPAELPTPIPTITLDPGADDPPFYYGGLVMTLDNVGETMVMRRRGSFLLALGNSYDWVVSISPADVITRNPNLEPQPGEQGVYVARRAGRATISAIGDPVCARDDPPCARPSVLFTLNIVVE